MDPSSAIGIVGENTSLVCQAEGSPVPNIEWLKDGETLGNSDRINISSSANGLIQRSNITVTNLNFGDSGNYTCRANSTLTALQLVFSEPAVLTVNRKYKGSVCNTLLLSLPSHQDPQPFCTLWHYLL